MMIRRMLIILAALAGVGLLAVAGVVLYVVETEKAQFKANAALAGYEGPSSADTKTLVVYFSRSGNTELMALEIAKTYDAEVVHLEAADYRIGLMGWINAMKDARGNHAVITPETIDLAGYDTIFIGSPIWLYNPAPPVWQFAAANDFSGKKIVLFNTFNSKFEQSFIDEFKQSVEARGGLFIGHVWVKRGRMTDQINSEELLRQVREKLSQIPPG